MLLLVRWLGATLIVLIAIYVGLWARARLSLWYHHYRHLWRKEVVDKQVMEQLDEELACMLEDGVYMDPEPLTTVRQWPEGEQAYWMSQDVTWVMLYPHSPTQCQASWAEEQPQIRPLVEQLKECNDPAEITAQSQPTPPANSDHIFVTNCRIVLVSRHATESISYEQMESLDLSLQTVSIELTSGAVLLLHSHNHPQTIMAMYGILHNFFLIESGDYDYY